MDDGSESGSESDTRQMSSHPSQALSSNVLAARTLVQKLGTVYIQCKLLK